MRASTSILLILTACAGPVSDGDTQPDAGPCEDGVCSLPPEPPGDPCSPESLGTSYIGCEYFPTVLGNNVGTTFDFAVAMANSTAGEIEVTIEGGALTAPRTVKIAAGSVEIAQLPWQPALKLCNGADIESCLGGSVQKGALAVGGAYHVRSTAPITVYQFNPLQYAKGDKSSYSNDASLLLPTNVWGKRYVTAAFGAFVLPFFAGTYPSELAITAMTDGTKVRITPTAATEAGQGAPAFAKGATKEVTLNAGDVLELASMSGDLTGSLVEADKPIQVLGGHYCTNVPSSVPACDHLEESMFPIEALGTSYVVNAPAMSTMPEGKVQNVRIIATEPNTTLTYDPPQSGAPTTIASAGGFIEIAGTAASFRITSSAKVLVAQYMAGQNAGGGMGDPAMALAVPVEQFRASYLFHAPINYDENYVDVTAPVNATIMIDHKPVTLVPIGTSGFGLARVKLDNGSSGDGNHSATGTAGFGLSVYGYGRYTSYWYPGGSNVDNVIL